MSLDIDLRSTFTASGAEPFTVAADLSVADGETLVVLGPSGSGKTLLLECIAGVHEYEGRVAVAGRDVTDAAPEDRELGFVFQNYALFPHLTVRENVAYGTRYHETETDPMGLLSRLGIDDLADRSPPTLSGGEQQRVALARSLAVHPDAFLLDEPLSALDVPTRADLRGDLAEILADETAVYVTHNRTTARALGDRIAVIAAGEIRQVGTPETIFERPKSPFVARFTGTNCLPRDRLPAALADALPPGDHVVVRPEHLIHDDSDPDLTGAVVRTIREDATYRVLVDVDGLQVDVFVDEPPAGEEMGLSLPVDRCHVIAE